MCSKNAFVNANLTGFGRYFCNSSTLERIIYPVLDFSHNLGQEQTFDFSKTLIVIYL